MRKVWNYKHKTRGLILTRIEESIPASYYDRSVKKKPLCRCVRISCYKVVRSWETLVVCFLSSWHTITFKLFFFFTSSLPFLKTIFWDFVKCNSMGRSPVRKFFSKSFFDISNNKSVCSDLFKINLNKALFT